MRMRKSAGLLSAGVIIFGLETAVALGFNPGVTSKILLGFLSFFFLPGYCLAGMLLEDRESDFIDRLGLGYLLSLALFALPGLLCFALKLPLTVIFWSFLGIGVVVWLLSLFAQNRRAEPDLHRPSENYVLNWTALLMAIAAGVLAYYAGASRGPEHDWDLYNYISMVRKFLVWGSADIHHYFYLDAPPDPIHSYNLQALLFAVVALKNRIDPIPLYIRTAFLTVPLCFLSFLSLSRRALSELGGFFAFSFYFFFQLIFGGLYFVGNSTFYPDDSVWLLCFPSLLSLAFLYLNNKRFATLALTGLACLGVSIVHPIWGLAFYMTLSFYLFAESLRASEAFKGGLESPHKFSKFFLLLLVLLLVVAPYLASGYYIYFHLGEISSDWFAPLFAGFWLDRLWFYALLFIVLPGLLFLIYNLPFTRLISKFRASDFYNQGYAKNGLLLVLVSLAFALPYIYLRAKAIQSTQWSSFGHNPYRGFITPVLFLLNPFKRSFSDPNMTFHPFFWLALVCSPWLFKAGKQKARPELLVIFYGFLGVVLLVMNPVGASLFAKFFSLGYLRRILRLAGILGFLAPAAFCGYYFDKLKIKQSYAAVLTVLAAVIISIAMVPVPGEALYSHLLKRMAALTKLKDKDSLLYPDPAVIYLAQSKLVKPDDVVMSDLYTSFRLTAYLGCYVVAQAKPGVGVEDQAQRRQDELDFFATDASLARMKEIAKRRKVKWVIVNNNLQYSFYDIPLGHPEAIVKMKSDPSGFEMVFEQGDWAVFKALGN
jgi:hypothetical protein